MLSFFYSRGLNFHKEIIRVILTGVSFNHHHHVLRRLEQSFLGFKIALPIIDIFDTSHSFTFDDPLPRMATRAALQACGERADVMSAVALKSET